MKLPPEAKKLLEQEIKTLKGLQKKIHMYMLGSLAGGALQILRAKKELEDLLYREILAGKSETRRARIKDLQKLVKKIISAPAYTDKDLISSQIAASSFSNTWATAQITGTPFDWDSRIRKIVATENARAYSDVVGEVAEDYKLVRKWVSILDARTCKLCASMDGEETLPGQNFKDDLEPAWVHPSCRCYSILILK